MYWLLWNIKCHYDIEEYAMQYIENFEYIKELEEWWCFGRL